MYLSNKQILQLIIPLFLGAFLLFFQEDIITIMHKQFPKIKTIKKSKIYYNINQYLKISKEMQTYDMVSQKMSKRKDATEWVAARVLSQKQSIQNSKKADAKKQQDTWNLQIVFPEHNMAIINSQFAYKGSIINGAKVMQIEFDSVLLKTKKGLRWVHLFR